MKHLLLAVIAFAASLALSCAKETALPGSFPSRTNDGAISFTLTPRSEKGNLVVEVRANTHSGDLATLDLTRAMVMEVEGKIFHPTMAGSLTGHHASTTVTFEPGVIPAAFAIKLASGRESGNLVFRWP